MRKTIAGVLLAAAPMICHAEPPTVHIPGGFFTGNEYEQHSRVARAEYLEGLYDGYMFAPFVAGSNKTTAPRMHDCASHMQLNAGQLVAIVDKFMADNPERWGEPMNRLGFSAIFLACEKIGIPLGIPGG